MSSFSRRVYQNASCVPLLSRGRVVVLVESGALLALLLGFLLRHSGSALIDFRGGLWDAGRDVLQGHDPYRLQFLAHQVELMRRGLPAIGRSEQSAFSVPLYPAPANLAVVPLSLLPFGIAGVLYTFLSLAAFVGGLRLLGVRDWRCVIVAVGSYPFLYGLMLGSIGPWLVLGSAIAWQFRDRAWVAGLTVAGVVVVKIFPWPLAVWLLITRRYRALAIAVASGVVITLGAWLIVGIRTLATYPRMLSDATLLQQGRATSPAAIMLALGASPALADALTVVVAVALLGLAWFEGRHRGATRQAFALGIIAALLSTPIVWQHYMVLLFVPIALLRPRLSPIWFVPLASPVILELTRLVKPWAHSSLRQTIMWVAIEILLVIWVETTRRADRKAESTRLGPEAAGVTAG